jgi:hypothetical protein
MTEPLEIDALTGSFLAMRELCSSLHWQDAVCAKRLTDINPKRNETDERSES